MKRMIDNDLIATDNGTVQIGKDLEVDGKIHVNEASDIIDKDGKPIAGGGGGGAEWKNYTSSVDENKILLWEIHVVEDSQGLEGFYYLRDITSTYYGVPASAQGGTACGLVSVYFRKPQGASLWTVSPTSGYTFSGSTISALSTSSITCAITRVLVQS